MHETLKQETVEQLKAEFKSHQKSAAAGEESMDTEYKRAMKELEDLVPLSVINETAYHDLSLKCRAYF